MSHPMRVPDVDDLLAGLNTLKVHDQQPPATTDEFEQVDQAQLQKDLDIMFEEQARDKLAHVPEIDMPAQLKGLTLFDYQKDGIRWLVHQENSGKAKVPFFSEITYKNGQTAWRCSITRRHQRSPPKRIKGGILADDMGLGKTVQTLGLILSNPPKNHVYPMPNDAPKPLREVCIQVPVCTLIVCPVSVMSNWVTQVDSHVHDGVLRVALYAGNKRSAVILKIIHNKIDILVVSYDTLSADFKKSTDKASKGQTLFDAKFHRIVLDESHTVRSTTTGFFKSASAVKASTKICLTGTPFVNRPDDIHSLLKFLGLEPLSDAKTFRDEITVPIQQGRPIGLARLRTAMAHVALRRTKNATNIDLMGKEHYLRKVKFPEGDHKRIHDVLYNTTQAAFNAVAQNDSDGGLVPFFGMFELVLRIRQACCSGELIPEERFHAVSKIARKLKVRNGDLSVTEGLELFEALMVRRDDVDSETEIVDTKDVAAKEPSGRPKRKASKGFKLLVAKIDSDGEDDENRGGNDSEDEESDASFVETNESDDELSDYEPTPKKRKAKPRKKPAITCRISQTAPKILALLQTIEKMDVDEKAVIFSQFTTFLDRLEPELKAHGHSFTRIDGSMNAASRIEAMREFNKEDVMASPRFILCSIRAAGTGINLTRGNVVFSMDPWWNRAVESQAYDRVHRLGQKRKVRVYSFVMEDSIEERMVTLQSEKAALGKGSMKKLTPSEERRAKLTAMKDLFEIVDAEDAYESDDDFFDSEGEASAPSNLSSDSEEEIVDSDDELFEQFCGCGLDM